MNRVRFTRVIAVLCSGLMAGLLFGDWLGPSFARSAMSESSFIQFQQIVHLNYLRTLPALSTLALAAPVLWLIMLRDQRDSGEFKLLLGATAAIAVGFTITFVFNVPVNDQLETWNAAAPPANAREVWNRWENAHIVRTIFWMAGFFLETMAIASVPSRTITNAPMRSHEWPA
jgi:uncharacterized membrane protein